MPTNPLPADDFDDTDPFADAPSDGAQTAPLTPEQLAEIERRMNINRLKSEAMKLSDGQMTTSEESDAPSEILEMFWENVVAYEKAPLVTMHQKIEIAHIEMPADGELNDEQLSVKLWQIIEWMAEQNTILYQTDHLSDRELYVWLRDDWFHEPDADMPGMTCHTSPIGSCGEDDMVIYHRYYADEEDRKMWLKDFPDDEMPPRETPPHDRDRFLPDSTIHLEDRRARENDWD